MSQQLSVKQLQVYCEKCKKTSWIEIEINNNSMENFKKSGLEIKSISHGDHILVIEIDSNYTIRKETVIHVISSVIENIVTQTVEKLLYYSKESSNKKSILLYASDSTAFREFFRSVVSILSINLIDDDVFSTIINPKLFEIQINKLKLALCYPDKLSTYSNQKNLVSIVIDLDKYDYKKLDLPLLIQLAQNCNIIIGYNSNKTKNIPEELINKFLSKGFNRLSLFDYSTSQGLKNIIDDSFRNLKY
jgi:hypothetical protein